VLGSVVAIAAVLPAEYGLDPTGIGAALGLLQLSASDAAEPAGGAAPAVATTTATGNRVTATLLLEPGDGIEYKLRVAAGERVRYRWLASGVLHFDMHGEPAGDSTGYYESYAVANADGVEGSFSAFFDGTHGWYWRNDTGEAVDIELIAAGNFQLVEP
jgi:hypothetical protein